MSPRGASPPSRAPPHPGELGFAGLRPRQGECSEGREPLGTGWVLRWPCPHWDVETSRRAGIYSLGNV